MSTQLATILVTGGLLATITALFWGVFMLAEWWATRRKHWCGDALTWCEHCMDDKQRVWAAHLRGEVKV